MWYHVDVFVIVCCRPLSVVFGNVCYVMRIQTQNRNVEQCSVPNLIQLVPKLSWSGQLQKFALSTLRTSLCILDRICSSSRVR
jgi:hypothetical protein